MKPVGSLYRRDFHLVKPKSFLKAVQVVDSQKQTKQLKEFNSYLNKVDQRMASIIEHSDARKSLEML